MEKYLINHASPTLAGIKPGNMFTVRGMEYDILLNDIAKWNSKFQGKITIELLCRREKSYLLIVYRQDYIKEILYNYQVQEFLRSLEYDRIGVRDVLDKIKNKLANNKTFPHEIGLLLGYPLEDVRGFFINKGREYKKRGDWVVYSNPDKATEVFNSYEECRWIFHSLFKAGYHTEEIIKIYKGEVV